MSRTDRSRDASDANLRDRVERIQRGDQTDRERLLYEYRPFIAGVVRKMSGPASGARSTDAIYGYDEFSIGLMAFNEALDAYRPEKNVPFLSFAGLVINRRLVDWFRKQASERGTALFTDVQGESGRPVEEQVASSRMDLLSEMEAEEEIIALRNRLEHLGLTFSSILRKFPKHRDSRIRLIRIAHTLAGDAMLMQTLEEKGRLPGTDLSRKSGVPVKTIEKHRDSIILLALFLTSELNVIKQYLKTYEEAEK